MARPPQPPGGSVANPVTVEFTTDLQIIGGCLTYDGWSTPVGKTAREVAAAPQDDEATPPSQPDPSDWSVAATEVRDASGGFSTGTGAGLLSRIPVPFAIEVGDDIPAPGFTWTPATENEPTGLAKVAAGIITHLDAVFDAVAAKLFDHRQLVDAGYSDTGRSYTAAVHMSGSTVGTTAGPIDTISTHRAAHPARSETATVMPDTGQDTAPARLSAAAMNLLASEVQSSATPTIFEARVAASADDAEERSTGSVTLTSSDLELSYDGTRAQTVGMRFTSVAIPQGAIITSAHIQFQTDEVKTGAASLLIRGQDSDDAAAFTTLKFDVSSRPSTDASAAWSPADWTTRGQAGPDQRTPDLTTIVQEIVSRSGWASLNDMVFLVTGTGTRTAESFEGTAAGAPMLHIEYLPPAPPSDPVVFNNSPDADTDGNQIAELAGAGTAVGITASASDPDAGSTVTYSISDPRFAIDPNTGIITRSGAGILDFETETSITLTVTATSSDTSSATQTFTLAVHDSAEPVAFNAPPDTDAANNRIAEDAAAGTAVGITASASDPDSSSTVSYSINDPRFAIDPVTGIVTRSDAGTLDAQSEATVNVTVTATSSDGTTASQLFSVGVTPPPGSTPTIFEARIASGSDDAEERSTGSMYLTSSDLELTFDGTLQQTVGVRFTNIDIPQGAVITSAYIQFQADEVKTGAASLLIRGEDADDAATFSGASFNVSSRATTDASSSWAPADWTTRGQAGPDQRAADLAAIVQEIVNRQGWAALNDMAFLISGTGTRTAESFEGSATAAPLLHIEYLLPGPVADPVVFSTPPDADSATNQIAELAGAGTAVGITASASDPDAGATVTFNVSDPRFAIDPVTGVVTRSGTGTLDFETQSSINLTVTATSSDTSAAAHTFTIAVLDGPEPATFNTPPDADSATNRIAESAAAGTTIGVTASARDPDAGSTVTYNISDPRFAIDANSGVVTRSGTGTLDFGTEPTVNLTVTATSSDGSTADRVFTVNVVPPAEDVLFRFAVFGDFGDAEQSGEQAVASLVNSWNVDFILTVGDNAYGSVPFDDAVGQFYSNNIGNYQGAYGTGSTINRFFPTLGNHEYSDGNFATYLNYFTLPDNERYYDFQAGSVHFFALNSNSEEPDGNGANSSQAQWIQAGLAASDAMFNMTYFHHTPYSPSGGGDSDMRWNFEAMGVDAVFAGHIHEYFRVVRDDNGDGVALPYTTTGLGGAGNSPPNVGANLVTVTDSGLLIEFYTVDGVPRDSCFVAAPTGGSPLFVNGNDVLNGTGSADYLWGLAGDDTISGFAGDDMLIGDTGNDLFVFGTGCGQDIVADFSPGAGIGDVLDLRAFGIDSLGEFQQVATNQGANVIAELGGGDRITLLDIQVAQFHDDDFRTDFVV